MPHVSDFSITRSVRRVIALLAAVAAAFTVLALSAGTAADAATPTPRAPHALPRAIEPLATYVGQDSCDVKTRPGTAKLAHLLASTYRSYSATTYSTTYACGTDGSRSEHYDGRAIDWMVDIHNKRQHAAALSAINWLLATDAAGNRFAMARRLGVMYLIYDNRIWGAWDGKWEPYNGCAHLKSAAYDNSCHRTHIHISLSWNGAMGRTTFWRGKVSPTDFGPCIHEGLTMAYRYKGPNTSGCPRVAGPRAGKHPSATRRAVVQWSGARMHHNSSGPAVTAVQGALHLRQTGRYTKSTVAAVKAFQQRHHCRVNGITTPHTWRALLAVTR